jgi:hypothetical protein
MTMPGFSGEASLVKTTSRYQSAGARFRRNGGTAASQIVASYIVQRCPPGYSYRCQWVYIGAYERYFECGCFRNYLPALPPD